MAGRAEGFKPKAKETFFGFEKTKKPPSGAF
jgi:hypothetical protein